MNGQRTHSRISQLNHDVLKYASFVCSATCSYRSLRFIGSNAKQQTDQLPQLSSRKGKYRAPPNLGEGFISLTFPVIRQGFCYRLVFSHHSLYPDLSCIRILFRDSAPCCVTSLYLTHRSPSHLASGFSGQRRARATSASSTTLLPPSVWFVWVLFLFCSLACWPLLPPFPSLLFLFTLVPGFSD